MTFKYIILDTGTVETPVLFTSCLLHKWVADSLKPLGTTIAAGFVKFYVSEPKTLTDVACFGRSTSMNLSTRNDDAQLIVGQANATQQ